MCLHELDAEQQIIRDRLDLLTRITNIPTATGKEHRVIEFIRGWVAERADLVLTVDRAGNLVVSMKPDGGASDAGRVGRAGDRKSRTALPRGSAGGMPPLFITAHLDHPAFVVERVDERGGTFEVSFRGGVNDVFFEHAPITLHLQSGPVPATLTGAAAESSPAGKHYLAELDRPDRDGMPAVGDIATWTMKDSEIDSHGILHAPACDDLAAAAAALAAFDALRKSLKGPARAGVRLLFTLAEEIGFIGAIAACRVGTIPRGSVLLALENSRAFADCPAGGGPVVRVGDRLSIFTPWVTAACARAAEKAFGGPSAPTASQTQSQAAKRPWQRKLMSGGACEASVFCHAGYDATCLCLPLGNYHNMPHLEKLQAGQYDATALGPPRCEREFIDTRDYLGLVDLLIELGRNPPRKPKDAAGADADFGARLDKMFAEKRYVLGSVEVGGGENARGKRAGRASAGTRAKVVKGKSAGKGGGKRGVKRGAVNGGRGGAAGAARGKPSRRKGR